MACFPGGCSSIVSMTDVERRETMAKLTSFLATPPAWIAILSLLETALISPVNEDMKRRQRVCFFAANALLSKIKKESISVSEVNILTNSIHSLVLITNNGEVSLRDPTKMLLGKTTIKRLILCLATLTWKDFERLPQYVDHASSILMVDSPFSPSLALIALDMLLAVANPCTEDEDDENGVVFPDEIKRVLESAAFRVFDIFENFVSTDSFRSSCNSDVNFLLLENVRAWISLLFPPSIFRNKYPNLFKFTLSSLAMETKLESLRASAALFSSLAEIYKNVDNDDLTKDFLLDAVLYARSSFTTCTDDELAHSIAYAFSKVAELDVSRIVKGSYPRYNEMLDFSFQILNHKNRSSVARNSLDFFLCIQDVPVHERVSSVNESFFLRLLGSLVVSCQLLPNAVPETPEEEDDDILMFRNSTDGPKDLFVSIYSILPERYLAELVLIITSPKMDYLQAESALYALRCSSKEICQFLSKKDIPGLSRRRNHRLILFNLFYTFLQRYSRSEIYFRAEMCAAIGDFSSLLQGLHTVEDESSQVHLIPLNVEYLIKNIEDPAANLLLIAKCSSAFQKISSKYGKQLAPFIEALSARLRNCPPLRPSNSIPYKYRSQILESSQLISEGLSRICSEHIDPIQTSKVLLEPFLIRAGSSFDSQDILILSSAIKYLPPNCSESVFRSVFPFLDAWFRMRNQEDDAISSICDLIQSLFFSCMTAFRPETLNQILQWTTAQFNRKPLPNLASLVAKSIELFSNGVLSSKDTSDLIISLVLTKESLISEFPDSTSNCIDAVRRAFLFIPDALFQTPYFSKLIEFVMNCVIVEEKEIVREACVLLIDMINRTRQTGDITRWSTFQMTFDKAIYENNNINKLADHVARSLISGDRVIVVDPLCDLLFYLLRIYSIQLSTFNGTLEEKARVETKEGFRRFISQTLKQIHCQWKF